MFDAAFYIFSFLALLCGALVVTNRNPVTSAMCLVLCIVSLAGLFVLMQAYFLAVVQILVYAGAVIVLFLFVIMLLDLKEEARRRIRLVRAVLGFVSVGMILALVIRLIWSSKTAGVVSAPVVAGEPFALGMLLFDKSGRFLLPFEILSVLLLVAMVGVILLSKKDLR